MHLRIMKGKSEKSRIRYYDEDDCESIRLEEVIYKILSQIISPFGIIRRDMRGIGDCYYVKFDSYFQKKFFSVVFRDADNVLEDIYEATIPDITTPNEAAEYIKKINNEFIEAINKGESRQDVVSLCL